MKINDDLYEYKYDNLYNITDIYLNKELINHYEYDNFNELIKEDNYILNKTIEYTYDTEGNILNRKEYEFLSLSNEVIYFMNIITLIGKTNLLNIIMKL